MAAKEFTDYDSYIHEPDNTNLDHIPGDWGLPVIGHTLEFFKEPVHWAQKNYKKYGPLVKLNSTLSKSLAPLGPDLMQQIFTDPGQNFSSKAGFHRLERFFGSCLIAEDFGHHKHQRRIMQTAFKVDSLKTYTSEVNSIYDRALHNWESDAGNTIPFFQHIKNLLLVVAAEVFFGEKQTQETAATIEKLNKAFMDTVAGTLYLIPYAIPGGAVARGYRGRKVLDDYFRPLVPLRRAGDGHDMLSYFCREKDEEGNFYGDDDIVSQMIFLLFAAHDTTTAAITHTIYFLAKNPEIKERLYQECKSIGKDTLEFDDLGKMEYMQQVFNEVLRFRPSVPVLPRRTVREVELAGYKVPAHTSLMLITGFNHFMEEYWTEPNKFDPERFSAERAEHKKHPFQYHPFGGGAHKCIGMHFSQMEYKCFLHKFMLKFDFEPRHKKEPHLMTLPIPKPADEMPIELSLR